MGDVTVFPGVWFERHGDTVQSLRAEVEALRALVRKSGLTELEIRQGLSFMQAEAVLRNPDQQ